MINQLIKQVIVMACNEEESGKHKCECYWVDKEQETRNCGPYTVKLLKARRMCDDFNLRTMDLAYSNSAGETGKQYLQESLFITSKITSEKAF